MDPLRNLSARAKQVAAVATCLMLFGSYVAYGLSLYPTHHQTDQKIDAKLAPIVTELQTVKKLVLEGTLETLDLKKNFLRNDRFTLERSMEGADVPTRITSNRRLGQINDELQTIDERAAEIRKALGKLTERGL